MTIENILHRAGRFKLPDPPPREPDEVTAFDHIYQHGNNRYLALHFGNPDTTLVVADRWIVASPEDNRARARRPDLLIAFNVSPEDYAASNGYIISEQGKPPDFVMEVASESTADVDTGAKRTDYAAWASWSTGASIRPETCTAPSWPATSWREMPTDHYPLKKWPPGPSRGTARP